MSVHGVFGGCERDAAAVGRISFRCALGVNLESRSQQLAIGLEQEIQYWSDAAVCTSTSVLNATEEMKLVHTLGAIMGRDDSSERPMLLCCDSRRICTKGQTLVQIRGRGRNPIYDVLMGGRFARFEAGRTLG